MTDLFDIHRMQMLAMEQERKYKVQCDNYRLYNELLQVPIRMMEAQTRGMISALLWGLDTKARM